MSTTDKDKEVPNDVDKSLDCCQTIFRDILGMKRATVKIVRKRLNSTLREFPKDITQ